MKKIIVVILLVVLGGIVLFFFNPTSWWFMPKCPFKLITGLSCPGCGIQRAIHAILHGHIREAVHYNYYLLYSGPYSMMFVMEWMLPKGNARNKLKSIIENKKVVYFYVVTFSLWLIIRNILNI